MEPGLALGPGEGGNCPLRPCLSPPCHLLVRAGLSRECTRPGLALSPPCHLPVTSWSLQSQHRDRAGSAQGLGCEEPSRPLPGHPKSPRDPRGCSCPSPAEEGPPDCPCEPWGGSGGSAQGRAVSLCPLSLIPKPLIIHLKPKICCCRAEAESGEARLSQ